MRIYPNGLGEQAGGDQRASQKPLLMSGDVWWVNSVTGTDAASPAGKDQQKPLATLVQANTNAADNDIIVLQSGHTETLTVALALKAVTVIGIGTTAGKPAAQIKINAAAAIMLQFTASAGELANIYFPAAVQTDTSANGKVRVASISHCIISGCYFESSALDQLAALEISAAAQGVIVEDCTFISTASSGITRPTRGLHVSGAVSEFRMTGNVFDDGGMGYSTAACDLSGGTITRLRAYGNSFLRGAETLIASATVGYFFPPTQSGGAKVTW